MPLGNSESRASVFSVDFLRYQNHEPKNLNIERMERMTFTKLLSHDGIHCTFQVFFYNSYSVIITAS